MSYSAQNAIWDIPMRPSSMKFVLLALGMRADKTGECFPSVARLVLDTGLERKTVMTSITMLEKLGLINVRRSRGAGNKYSLNLEAIEQASSSESSTDIGTTSSTENGSTKNGTSTDNGTRPVPKTGLDQYQKRDTNLSVTYQEPINKEEAAPKKRVKPKPKPIPDEFVVTEAHREWANKNHIGFVDERYAHFRDAAEAKGYEYVDWTKAFYNAMRQDWARLNQGKSRITSKTKTAGVHAA